MFLRVVEREGWVVELVERGETRTFAAREPALEFAQSLAPDWIEVGHVVAATGQAPRHHEWTTLRRRPDGAYAPSGLSWGGRA